MIIPDYEQELEESRLRMSCDASAMGRRRQFPTPEFLHSESHTLDVSAASAGTRQRRRPKTKSTVAQKSGEGGGKSHQPEDDSYVSRLSVDSMRI